MPKRNKNPKSKAIPIPQKTPKTAQSPTQSGSVVWSFAMFDNWHAWQSNEHRDNHFCEIATHLKDREGVPWLEIIGNARRDHFVAIEKLCGEAQKRLETLNIDDVDELLSLHLNGLQRIWGLKKEQVFQVLWWDPQHRVCPSNRK